MMNMIMMLIIMTIMIMMMVIMMMKNMKMIMIFMKEFIIIINGIVLKTNIDSTIKVVLQK